MPLERELEKDHPNRITNFTMVKSVRVKAMLQASFPHFQSERKSGPNVMPPLKKR
jgi:hypothetical protein